jgi:anion transporter
VPKDRFELLLARHPSAALHLTRVLSRRLQEARRAAAALGPDFADLAGADLPPLPTALAGEAAAPGLAAPPGSAPAAATPPAAAAATRSAWLATHTRRTLGRANRAHLLGLGLAVAIGAVFALLPAPADLYPAGWTALGLLAIFVPILVFEVVPDYVAALLLVVAWVVLGVVPPRVALAGYASGAWMLVLAVLALGAAVAASGLLYRATLLALTRLPPTHVAQGLALAGLGLVFSPAMPNATARTAMAAPLACEMADALCYPPESRPRAGLALATLFGFGQTAGLFLTASSTGLLVHGLLPPEVRAQFTWWTWLLAALPLHLVILLVGLVAALRLYGPHAARAITRERVALQQRLLGPPSRNERITLAVLLLVLGGFVTQPLHGVDPAWVGVVGLCILLISGALDQSTFRSGMNWTFLLYLGVLIGLGDVFVAVGLDQWLAARLTAVLGPLTHGAPQFVLALTLCAFALSLVVRWQAASVLLTLMLTPVAAALGINPWVVGIVALVATNTWFLPYQSTIYLALYYGMDATFTHRQVRPIAWANAVAVLAGVALSMPYWRALGLLP